MKMRVLIAEEEESTIPQMDDSAHARDNHLKLITPLEGSPSEGDLGFMDLKKKWSNAFEKEYLVTTLKRFKGNVSAAARYAKLDRSNFLRLLRRHNLKAEGFRGHEMGEDPNLPKAA